MKIRKVETFPLYYALPEPYGDANGIKKYRSVFLIRLITESGLTGWGEAVDWLPALQVGFRERIGPYLIGKSAFDRNRIVQTVKKWHTRSAAAVSMALTEILAVASGRPVTDLWGGALRDEIPVYASFQSYTDHGDWRKRSLRMVDDVLKKNSFAMIKVKIGGKSVEEDMRHATELHSMLEGRVRLALDANQSYDLATALKWRCWFDQHPNVEWLEEPLPLEQTSEYALLRGKMDLAVAGGENKTSQADFLPWLQQQALDIITPDPHHVGGIDEYRHVLSLARSLSVRVSPHCYDGALNRLYALFAHACLPPWTKTDNLCAIEPVEWDVMDNPFNQLIGVKPFNGRVKIPSGIGLGVDIDTKILSHYCWNGEKL